MADISKFIRRYSSYQTTFKDTSHDTENNESLCSDESIQNINFDKIIEEKYPDSNKRPKSFDSIFVNENTIYCIEFKNEKKPDKKAIEEKLLDGKKELEILLSDLNIQKNNYKFTFCVVYNIFKPKEERYKRGISNYPIKSYLTKYVENHFIDAIFTENVSFFSKEFEQKTKKHLLC